MKKQLLKATALLFALGSYQSGMSQTNPTAQTLPYTQNFGTGTFTVAPTGMAVWTINSSPASSQSNAESSTPNGNATITPATTVQTTGDAYGFATSSNGRLYFQTSSNTTNGTNQPVLAINTTAKTNISLSYGIEMISGTARTIGFVLQYRVGISGSWTDVSGGVYSHNSSDRTNGQVDTYTVTLPSAAENQSVVQLRWACWRGTQSGNSSGAALDNISVTATSQAAGYFRSKQNGNWNLTSTWQASPDSATWVNASVVPDYHANSILVKDSVSITANDSIDQVTVSTSGILTYANITGSTVYIMNGIGVDLNVLGKYYDAGSNSNIWATGSTWQLGSTASLIRNRSTSSDMWRDHYYGTTSTIPSTSNWVVIKNSTDNPSISSVNGAHYGNLSILNTTGSLWTTSSSSSFTGSTDFPIVTGNLYIGGSGGVSFLNSNTNASPVKVIGNTTVASGSTIRNQGTGLELQGDVTISGTLSTTGSAYILLSGNNTQTMSGSGLSFQYLTVHKSSFPATVTLSSPAIITGTLTLTNGLIVSDTVNLLTFNAGAAVNGVNNDTSFVSGPVKKIGNTAFTFPLGKNVNAQTIAITAPTNTTDAFQAEYFDTNPTTIYGVYTDTTFNYISTCEYFVLKRKNGTSNIQPTLGYDLTSCVSNLLPAPRVIGYNGTKWKDLGITNLTYSPSGGTASTASVITQYGAITLGNSNPLITNTPTGDTCFAAIVMPSGATSTLTGQTQSTGHKWFTFTPTTPEVQITLTNTSMGSNHIHDIVLLEGLCYQYMNAGHDSSRTDTTLTIRLHEALVGVPYYIMTFREHTDCYMCSSPANFNLKVESLTPPTQTVSNGIVFFNGYADHMKEEVIISVAKAHLNMSNVDNTSITSGTASLFFDATVTQSMAGIMFNNDTAYASNLQVRKVYPTLTSADSMSLSRDSQYVKMPPVYEVFVITIPKQTQIYKTSRTFCTSVGINYAHPNYVGSLLSTPNDTYYPNQAGLYYDASFPNSDIRAVYAWDVETGQPFVKIGVYDCGIDGTHADLNGSKVAGGYDFTSGTAISAGTNNCGGAFHGTACAGIIGARRNNGIGVAGIAGGDDALGNAGCSIYDMKIASGSTYVSMSTICASIISGASSGGYGLHIMNHSWAVYNLNDLTLQDAVRFASQNGVILVASRGNYFPASTGACFNDNFSGLATLGYHAFPSCFQDEQVLNIGSSGNDGNWKSTNNGHGATNCDNYQSMTGYNVDVMAPGNLDDVYTTMPGNSYGAMNGTSAAAPHVAGVAGLILSHCDQPNPSPNNLVIEDVEYIIQTTAHDNVHSPSSSGYDGYSGWGLMDAYEAVNEINTGQFKIQHFGVGQNATNATPTGVETDPIVYVNLTEACNGLTPNNYYASRYKVTVTLNYHLSDPNDVVVDAWPRFSSTLGWHHDTPLGVDNWCNIVSVTTTQAVLETYVYNFYADANGHHIDPWLPTAPANVKVALSILTTNSPTGINKINKSEDLTLGIFPNPAQDNATINVTLSKSQQISLEMYDVQGKLVKNISKEKAITGKNQYQVSLADLAEGVYYVRLVSEEKTCSKKLVIVK